MYYKHNILSLWNSTLFLYVKNRNSLTLYMIHMLYENNSTLYFKNWYRVIKQTKKIIIIYVVFIIVYNVEYNIEILYQPKRTI